VADPATVPEAQVIWDGGGAFVVRLHWRQVGEDVATTAFQAVWAPGDTIREIAGYRSLGAARKAAKRLASRSAA
jgi:hypothetical protein